MKKMNLVKYEYFNKKINILKKHNGPAKPIVDEKRIDNIKTDPIIKKIDKTDNDYIYDGTIDGLQCCVSESLIHLKDRLFKKYSMIEYNNIDKPSVFFGIYRKEDIERLQQHSGKKIIIWGGTDCNVDIHCRSNMVKLVKNLSNVTHLSISECISNSLKKRNVTSLPFCLNMVDKDIFKPVSNLGSKIFIYNGIAKGNEQNYGKEIYEEIVKRLPEFEYIYSNELGIPYEKMPEIYSRCFIGLRLTQHDGNANMIQDIDLMIIPFLHYFSKYGINYESIYDIILKLIQ
jgi:hypothetical protein